MNLLRGVFNLGENALGGLLGNVARLFVVAIAIGLTLKGRHWLERIGKTT